MITPLSPFVLDDFLELSDDALAEYGEAVSDAVRGVAAASGWPHGDDRACVRPRRGRHVIAARTHAPSGDACRAPLAGALRLQQAQGRQGLHVQVLCQAHRRPDESRRAAEHPARPCGARLGPTGRNRRARPLARLPAGLSRRVARRRRGNASTRSGKSCCWPTSPASTDTRAGHTPTAHTATVVTRWSHEIC